jgi:hypothetical protein
MRTAIPSSAMRRRMVEIVVRVMVHLMRVPEMRRHVHERMRMHKVWGVMEGRHLFLSAWLLLYLFLLLFRL